MSLPPLKAYSKDEITRAKRFSPALSRYLNWISEAHGTNENQVSLHLRRHLCWCECALATLFNRGTTEEVCKAWSESADILMRDSLDEAELLILAMGKLGSSELNLSSDVDLVCLSREPVSQEQLSRLRKWSQNLSSPTPRGFVFRIDWDLRPGGRNGPLISSVDQASHYYWGQGEAWERLAFVRWRPITGPLDLIEDFNRIMEPYVYRRYIDPSVIEELRGLRQKIQQHRTNQDGEIDLKLTPGGIRDIELFVHTWQVMFGGRYKALRTRSTSQALESLQSLSLLPQETAKLLNDSYWKFRRLENLVQLIEDKQTHVLSERLASELSQWAGHDIGLSHKSLSNYQSVLERTKEVDKVVSRLLGDSKKVSSVSRKSHHDEHARRIVMNRFIEEMDQTGVDANLGLDLLLDFFRSIRAKATFFHLLSQDQDRISELALLFSSSPLLSQMVISRPELLDSWFFGLQSEEPTDPQAKLEYLTEKRLLTELLAAKQFLINKDLTVLQENLSRTADSIVTSLLDTHSLSHLKVLALGKWGGFELGIGSDLDFIFISEKLDEKIFKAVRNFVYALTSPHRGGTIYPIDLRLRPSGRAGPVVVLFESLLEHLSTKAGGWENQSYLRSRFVGESPDSSSPEAIRRSCIARPLDKERLQELKEVRLKLFGLSSPEGEIAIKNAAGGITDIELSVQTAFLSLGLVPYSANLVAQMNQLSTTQAPWRQASDTLQKVYVYLRKIEQLYRMLGPLGSARVQRNTPAFARLSRLLRVETSQLEDEIRAQLRDSSQILKDLDPIWKTS